MREQERKVSSQKGQCPEQPDRNVPFLSQAPVFSTQCSEQSAIVGRGRGPAAPDTASVDVMDVEKPNPSRGVRWHHQDKECKQFGPGKELPFFLFGGFAPKVIVSSHSLLSWKPMQRRKNEAKVKP